jgi:integrase
LTKALVRSQTPIREVFKAAFTNNDLPYRKPHTFRHSIARKMKKGENATERLIALAENVGQRSGMATIISSYGGDYLQKQAEILKNFKLE